MLLKHKETCEIYTWLSLIVKGKASTCHWKTWSVQTLRKAKHLLTVFCPFSF